MRPYEAQRSHRVPGASAAGTKGAAIGRSGRLKVGQPLDRVHSIATQVEDAKLPNECHGASDVQFDELSELFWCIQRFIPL
jgi:hypothetical protein